MSLPTLFAGKSAPGLSAALDLRFALDKSLTAYRGPTPSFSRASTGTYFNSSGVLTSAATNAPRFNHTYNGTSWVSRGLLVEEQRTNLALYSEQFGNAVWAINAATISANVISAPDGNTTADKIQETASGGSTSPYINQSINYTSGNKYTLSCFVKAAERNYVVLGWYQNSTDYAAVFNLTDGTVSNTYGGATAGTATDIGGGWLRCAVTFNCTGSGAGSTIIGPRLTGAYANYSPTAGYGIYLWGAQVEAGAFPTSYIGTTNSSVVRSADVCQITGGDFSGFWNGTEGSFSADFDHLFPASAGTLYPYVYEADGGSASNRILLFGQTATSKESFYVEGGGVNSTADNSPFPSAGVQVKVASAYKVNDLASSMNGGAVSTDTSQTLPTVSRLSLGYSAISSGVYLNGHIARLRYYRKRLPNETLQLLSEPDPTLNLQFALNKTLTPVTGPAPSFSRASTGTYFNASGVLTSASINTPRFDHVYSGGQWVSRGLLLEEQRTNSLNYSEDFTNAIYVKNNATVLSNAGVAPDGTATADLIYPTASSSGVYYNSYSGTSQYSASVFAKAAGKSFFYFYANDGASLGASFNLSNGTVSNVLAGSSATITNVGNGWFRCTITSPSTASYLLWQVAFQDAQGSGTTVTPNGTDGILFWGAQRELGAFATSYTGTTSSSVTRSADVCQITGTSFNWMWNQGEGSALIEFDLIGRNESSGSYAMAWQADDNTLNNRLVQIAYEYSGTPSNAAGIYVATSGTGQANMYGTAIGVNTLGRSAFAWKTNDFALSVNGGAVATDTSGSIPPTNQINFGRRISDGYLNGHISKLIYYPARLLDAKLQKLST